MARKNYPKEFKDNAVRMYLSSGKTMSAVAAELKVNALTLKDWVKASDKGSKKSPDYGEVVELKKKLKQLEMENEILKKAAAYFAKQHP